MKKQIIHLFLVTIIITSLPLNAMHDYKKYLFATASGLGFLALLNIVEHCKSVETDYRLQIRALNEMKKNLNCEIIPNKNGTKEATTKYYLHTIYNVKDSINRLNYLEQKQKNDLEQKINESNAFVEKEEKKNNNERKDNPYRNELSTNIATLKKYLKEDKKRQMNFTNLAHITSIGIMFTGLYWFRQCLDDVF